MLIKSILSNETTISPKSPCSSNYKNSLNRSLKKHKNSKFGNVFNLTGNFTKKRRGKIMLNKSNAKSKEKLCQNIDEIYVNKKKSVLKSREKSAKRNHENKLLSAKRNKSPGQNCNFLNEKKLSIDVDQKAFTMNKGDLKKLTQEIKLDEKLTAINQNKSQMFVKDERKYSDNSESSECSVEGCNIFDDPSEDKLDTESEAVSTK